MRRKTRGGEVRARRGGGGLKIKKRWGALGENLTRGEKGTTGGGGQFIFHPDILGAWSQCCVISDGVRCNEIGTPEHDPKASIKKAPLKLTPGNAPGVTEI